MALIIDRQTKKKEKSMCRITNRRQHMQLTKEITKVIDNFLHEKGIYGVDRDDLEHKIAETINGKER